jgi:hypothetical protein
VPVATHNQRGLGTLHIGCPRVRRRDRRGDPARDRRAVDVSEIYELMKRSDEAHVVEKAHRRPRFVEDCVREMIRGVVEPSRARRRAFVSARQENLETIHQHNVVAERFGTLAEIRRELDGRRRGRAHEPALPGSTRSSHEPARLARRVPSSEIRRPAEEVVGAREHGDRHGHVDERETPGVPVDGDQGHHHRDLNDRLQLAERLAAITTPCWVPARRAAR